MNISPKNLDGNENCIYLTNVDDDFCFDSWAYHNDYEGVYISYYQGEELIEVSHRFENNNEGDSHSIDIAL